MKSLFYPLILVLIGCTVSCKKDRQDDAVLSTVKGTVFSPNGNVRIRGAVVQLSTDNKYKAITDASGVFELQVPVGNKSLRVYTGSGELFATDVNVEVVEGRTQMLDTIRLAQTGSVAYFEGDYDNMQEIFETGMGFSVTRLEPEDLFNVSKLKQHKMIFFNCGEIPGQYIYDSPADFVTVQKNVKEYISQGGKGLFTDFAYMYIGGTCQDYWDEEGGRLANVRNNHVRKSGQRVNVSLEALFKEALLPLSDMCGGFEGMSTLDRVNVKNSELAAILGKNTVDIDFDLDDFVILEKRSGFKGTVLLESSKLGIISFVQKISKGSVLYSSFHNHENITPENRAILEWYILSF